MVRKVYKKLTKEQKDRGVIFASTLSPTRSDDSDSLTTHEVTAQEMKEDSRDARQTIQRLKDDKFFNSSSYKFNIIRE